MYVSSFTIFEVYFVDFKEPAYGFLNSTVLNSLISTFFYFPSLFYCFFAIHFLAT